MGMRLCGSVHAPARVAAAPRYPDCVCRFGEREYTWVAKEQWSWCTQVQLSFDHPLLLANHTLLQLEGVDTSAQVLVNQQMHTINNYHRTWRLPLQPGTLQSGANSICITITPAEAEARRLKANSSYSIPTMQVRAAAWARPAQLAGCCCMGSCMLLFLPGVSGHTTRLCLPALQPAFSCAEHPTQLGRMSVGGHRYVQLCGHSMLHCAGAGHDGCLQLPAQARQRLWVGLGPCLCARWHTWGCPADHLGPSQADG